MKAVLGATPDALAERIRGGLAVAGMETVALESDSPLPSGSCLLIYSRPEYTVEAAVESGASVDEALEAWSHDAHRIVDLFRRNRPRVTVVHGPSLLSKPDAFDRWAQETLGRSLSVREPSPASTAHAAALHGLLAAQRVSASPELRDLTGELEACAVPLDGEPPEFPVRWEDAYRELQAARATAREVQAAEKTARDLQQALDTATKRQKEHEVRDGQIRELEEENELLLLQLHQVQEELESYYLEARELREKHGHATARDEDELTGYALMLEHLYLKLLRSRTWKLLAPLREVSRLLKSVIRRKRMPRNRLPDRPALLHDEPIGGFYGRRTRR